jgi:phosphoglucosamine mutase
MVVDSSGKTLAGEQFMAIIFNHNARHSDGTSPLITTIQSNLALDRHVKLSRREVVKTPVGDRNVVYAMLENDAIFGGENSGHYVFLDVHSTGDGLIAALKLLQTLVDSGKTLNELAALYPVFPSRLLNLKVAKKQPIDQMPNFSAEIQNVEDEMAGEGRILVRYSGTEPKLRILVEHASQNQIESYMIRLKKAAGSELDILE